MSYFAWNRYDTRALAEALAAASSPTWEAAQWYALVDTAFDAGRKMPFAFPPDSRAVYQGGQLDGLNAVSPLLVPLNGDPTLPESLALRLLHHCNGRPMLSFLRSSLTTDAICAAWQNVIEVETSDGEVFALRFADTRVTPVLASQTLVSLWARLSAAVNEWHTIDRGGALSLLPAVRGSVGGNEESRFRLDDAMLSRLLQSGEVDALATRLHAQMPELLHSLPGAQVHEILGSVAAMATEYGMTAQSDLLMLAVVCLNRKELLASAAFSTWLARRPWTTGDFADALCNFPG